MTTSRRSFLHSLALLAAAPLAARALVKAPSDIAPSPGVVELASQAYLLHGVGIKVPSNRLPTIVRIDLYHPHRVGQEGHCYVGDWDGTFRTERGCSNPAWVWYHLLEKEWPGGPLSLQMLYDYGVWCDQLVLEPVTPRDRSVRWHSPDGHGEPYTLRPRSEVNVICRTPEETDRLRDDLRMGFLSWRAGDPRWRRSWPVEVSS